MEILGTSWHPAEDSMLFWWPKVKDLGADVIMPKTFVVPIPNGELFEFALSEREDKTRLEKHREKIDLAVFGVGEPFFLRTDQSSGKHDWNRTCFVPRKEDLDAHIVNLVESNECADIFGLPYQALIFREYIPMLSGFSAFEGLPIGRERRYFVEDGAVVCHHPYWPPEAIRRPSEENWQVILAGLNRETPLEVHTLSHLARLIGERVEGAWSIDFCRSRDGRWIFIDMATAASSWHPEDCPNFSKYRTVRKA